MSIKRRNQTTVALFIISAIVSLDQFLKHIILRDFYLGRTIPVINNIFHITFVKNKGAAFGLFKQSTFIFIIISILASIILACLIIDAIRKKKFTNNFLPNFAFLLILSGAIGNLIDRIRLGYVVDFIDFRIWPVFNIADISITIGTSLLIYSFIFIKEK